MPFSIFSNFFRKSSNRPRGSSETLSNTAKIGGLLQHLLDDRVLLTIKIDGTENSFTSAVLSVDKTGKTFTLDEISPDEGHALFIAKKALVVQGQSRGALFSFSLPLQKQGTSNGIAYYEFDFPESINYVQRRSSFRARLKEDQRLSVTTFHKESGTAISGFVIDISRHGICVMFNTERGIQRGDRLNLCHIRLPDGQKITFDLEVRHVQTLPNERIRVGGNMQNISTRNTRLIEKYVFKLERESLRR